MGFLRLMLIVHRKSLSQMDQDFFFFFYLWSFWPKILPRENLKQHLWAFSIFWVVHHLTIYCTILLFICNCKNCHCFLFCFFVNYNPVKFIHCIHKQPKIITKQAKMIQYFEKSTQNGASTRNVPVIFAVLVV